MKRVKIATVLLFAAMVLALTACGVADNGGAFEIYLLADASEFSDGADIGNYRLADTPVLTQDDIIEYNWSEQSFTTSHNFIEQKISVNGLVPLSGLPFVVVCNGERIYAGFFWSPLSSQMAYSPSIYVIGTASEPDPEKQSTYNITTITIDGDDNGALANMTDKRIKDALSASGKLK